VASARSPQGATQHDAVLWLSGSAYDVIFDVARAAIAELAGVAALADETSSWPYRHDLDLTGFIDGTENPTLIDAPPSSSSCPRVERVRAGRFCCCRSGRTTEPRGSRYRFRRRRR
jgi:deferrochelatase/peroxidase EfeB